MSIDDQPVESKVDVLIIGAGPAGVMVRFFPCSLFAFNADDAALQAADMFARYTAQGLTCRIIDKRSASLDNGELESCGDDAVAEH